MRLSRRTAFAALTATLFAQLVACDKKETKKEPEQQPTTTTQAAQPTPPSEIIVGHFASMTGNTAVFGQDTDKAIRMHVDEINQAGGINGVKIKVETLDDRGDATEAGNAVARLIDVNKAQALLGEVASTLSLAGGRIAQNKKIPMISPSSTNPKVTQVGDHIFRVCFLDPFQGKVMATFARKNLKLEKVAILKDIKNDYSIGLAENFKQSFLAQGGTVTEEQSFAAGDTDFSAQLTAIKGKKPQALYVPAYYSEVGAIAKTAKRLGLKVPLLGGDGWDSPDLVKIGGEGIEGGYFSNHFAADAASPKAQKFVADYKARYNAEPSGLAALGYDAAGVLADAMRRAGGDAAKLRDAIAETKGYDGVAGKITIDENRNATKSAVVVKVTGGKFKYETTIEP